MKKILMFAVAGIAVCALAKSKAPTKAEIEKQDRANWGRTDYSGSADGQGSVENDYAQIKKTTRSEAAKMQGLYDFCNVILHGANPLDIDPETALASVLKELMRPIDPTPTRQLLNLNATPEQKLGFQSLIGAKQALARFGSGARAKMAALLKTEVEYHIYSDYNRLVRVATFDPIANGSVVETFKKVDQAWGKYLKLLDKIGDGKDKWKYSSAQLLDSSQKNKLFAAVLKESGLDVMFGSDGRIPAKNARILYTLDNYFKRATGSEIARFRVSVTRCMDAHNGVANALKEYQAWFAEHALKLDPYPRAIIKELMDAHAKYISRSQELLNECEKLPKELMDESKPVCKLLKCRGFSPNRAFFVRSGEVSERPPAYVRRVNELGLEMKKRFDEAVKKRLASAGRIQL